MAKKPNLLKSAWRKLPFSNGDKPQVSLITLNGAIGIASGPTSRRGLDHARLEGVIEKAFKPDNLSAVVLSINSPGGSPVQSRMIFETIRRHADEKQVRVLAFIEDIGASGGYMLAIAADEIYADGCSIVGSIGVVSAGFGLAELISRYGVERRVYTAGTNKAMLDPFQPEKPDDIAHFKTLLDDTHRQFIEMVEARRGNRISAGHDDIFTGRFWSGTGALERGLIDGLAQLPQFLRDRFGANVQIKKCSPNAPSLVSRLAGAGVQPFGFNQTGAMIDSNDLLTTIEERALWAQYGL